jgi:predicted transglutaminase-like cysteine proteinase
MMSEPIPIRKNVQPETDFGRELLDFCTTKIVEFTEDYALTKMGVLSEAQFPIVTNARIVGVMVHHDRTEDGHAVLAVLMPSGAVMFLDNNNAEPMTKAELERQGYQFVDWRLS